MSQKIVIREIIPSARSEHRAYKGSDAPGDLAKHRLGQAFWAAYDRIQHHRGDSGLALLVELEGRGFGVFELAEQDKVKEKSNLDDFFLRYNNAINNPAPDDDGGTTSYDYERLLDEAVELLEKLA